MTAGTSNNTNFFSNATANKMALVPAAAALVRFGNKSLGAGGAARYNSLVTSSQLNGAGPAVAPRNAPFSFTQFATGLRTISTSTTAGIKKRLKLK